jgi:hypothetical protein
MRGVTTDPKGTATRASLRTPRSAGVAGIVFSVLLGGVFLLIRLSVPSSEAASSDWLTDPQKRQAVSIALGLVPFAGIAFLWFIGVIRDQIGEREDRFFATVFLGSGLLFVAMVFVGTAIAGGLLSDPALESGSVPDSALWDLERRITLTLINTFAIRMAAIFIFSTTTIGMRTGLLPRWLTIAGFIAGVVLLFGVSISAWMNLVLPIWALVLSIDILVKSGKIERAGPAEG